MIRCMFQAYPGETNKDRRRQLIAESLASEVTVVPPSRLLTLLTQAVQWQQYQGLLPKGSTLDIFTNTLPAHLHATDTYPTRNTRVIHFGDKSHADVLSFSPNGRWLLTGSNDGFVEIWDYDTGKLSKELQYQANDQMMSHDSGISAVCWSSNTELIATATRKGEIKIWLLKTGACVRKWSNAHSEGVTCQKDTENIISNTYTMQTHTGRIILFNVADRVCLSSCLCCLALMFIRDGSQILSSSQDQTIK